MEGMNPLSRSLSSRPPRDDIDEADLVVHGEAHAAAGPTAVAVAMKRAVEQMGPTRTARTLLRLNQVDGFDCQGCAWPDPSPEHRHTAEFCENGAKAVTEEATRRRVDRRFFARHSLADLEDKTDYWLGQQGRIVEPMVKRKDATHYEPISWEDAFALMGSHLRGLASPDEAVFYTSGKTSNEAAFAYQLFARAYGTNNLPDCSNMCHESTSVALAETIGIGKGSVSLHDVETASLIVVAGQNPGTNHPRMLSALEAAKERGATIVAINPLREAGLVRFKNPQKTKGWLLNGTALADLHLPVRLNGDLALWQGVAHYLLENGAADESFVAHHTVGFEAWREHVAQVDWAEIERASGLSRAQVEELGALLLASDATVYCWAMGITQHRNAVATIKEIVNVALLQGNIGKPGAGLCPVRGHSNVQGDRTMGIWERPKPEFLDALQAEFGFDPPREHGLDTVDAVKAMHDGRARFFFAMGGNFASAVSDTEVTEEALRRTEMTVHVSTKLNRSHVTTGREALILPALGRSERDRTGGREQRVTVEDSMSAVHASKGPLPPASKHLRSEVDIVCSLAEATLGERPRHPLGRVPGRLLRHPSPDRRRRAGLRRLRREGRGARRVRAAAPAPRRPRVPDRAGEGGVLGQPARGARGAGRPPAAPDAAQPRPVQHHHLRPRRPLPRRQGRTARGVRPPRRHPSPGVGRRRRRRPGQRVGRRVRAHGAGLPDRGLRAAGRLRGGLLPGDEPAHPARLQGRGQQHPDVEVGRRAPREGGRGPGGHHAGGRRRRGAWSQACDGPGPPELGPGRPWPGHA